MKQRYDVVVIGAGPAGSMAARQAARLGASVLLVDKARFPRDKVCGCCLNRAALGTLERVGLGDLCDQQQARPLRQLALSAAGRTAAIALPRSAALSRSRLDMAMACEAVACGVTFHDQCTAETIQIDDLSLMLRTGSVRLKVRAGAIVAADGLGGRVLDDVPRFAVTTAPGSRMGCGAVLDHAPAHVGAHAIHMHCGEGGYVGLVQLEDGRLDVAAAFDLPYVQTVGGPGRAAAAIVRAASGNDGAWLTRARWRGTPVLTRRRRCVAAKGIFVIGDAAGFVEPFTGEGIAWALASGDAVADIAVQASQRRSAHLASIWARRHARLVRRRQRGCALIAAALRHPDITRAAIAALEHWPRIAQPIVRRITAVPPGAIA